MYEKMLEFYCKTLSFSSDRRGDEFAQKAVIVILVVVAGIAAFAAFGQKIVSLINQATAGL